MALSTTTAQTTSDNNKGRDGSLVVQGRPTDHGMPTICPQLQIIPVICSEVFMQVDRCLAL